MMQPKWLPDGRLRVMTLICPQQSTLQCPAAPAMAVPATDSSQRAGGRGRGRVCDASQAAVGQARVVGP